MKKLGSGFRLQVDPDPILVLILTLVMMGGGAQSDPLFLFVKTIEKVIRLCTVFFSGSFGDRWIVSSDKFVKNAHNMGLSSEPPLNEVDRVHKLITFSLVFIKKFFYFFLVLQFF